MIVISLPRPAKGSLSLPEVCLACGAPGEQRLRRRLLDPLRLRTVVLEATLCSSHARAWRRWLWKVRLFWGVVVGCALGTAVCAIVGMAGSSMAQSIGVLFLLAVAVIALLWWFGVIEPPAPPVWCAGITSEHVQLAGASTAVLPDPRDPAQYPPGTLFYEFSLRCPHCQEVFDNFLALDSPPVQGQVFEVVCPRDGTPFRILLTEGLLQSLRPVR
jgi:hypothetical protein